MWLAPGRRYGNEVLGNPAYDDAGHHLGLLRRPRPPLPDDVILCETIRRFKGLERPVVVLVELREDDPKLERLLYVGASRADSTSSSSLRRACWSGFDDRRGCRLNGLLALVPLEAGPTIRERAPRLSGAAVSGQPTRTGRTSWLRTFCNRPTRSSRSSSMWTTRSSPSSPRPTTLSVLLTASSPQFAPGLAMRPAGTSSNRLSRSRSRGLTRAAAVPRSAFHCCPHSSLRRLAWWLKRAWGGTTTTCVCANCSDSTATADRTALAGAASLWPRMSRWLDETMAGDLGLRRHPLSPAVSIRRVPTLPGALAHVGP